METGHLQILRQRVVRRDAGKWGEGVAIGYGTAQLERVDCSRRSHCRCSERVIVAHARCRL